MEDWSIQLGKQAKIDKSPWRKQRSASLSDEQLEAEPPVMFRFKTRMVIALTKNSHTERNLNIKHILFVSFVTFNW